MKSLNGKTKTKGRLVEKLSSPPYLIVFGIDPGLTGAISRFNVGDRGDMQLMTIQDMPVHHLSDGKSYLDIDTLCQCLDYRITYIDNIPRIYIIESQHSRPSDGVASAFKSGMNYGILSGVAALCGEVATITPQVWKKDLELSTSKHQSREMAINRFPNYKAMFKRVKDHNRAEAALIGTMFLRMELE